jgi:hypothetical protein
MSFHVVGRCNSGILKIKPLWTTYFVAYTFICVFFKINYICSTRLISIPGSATADKEYVFPVCVWSPIENKLKSKESPCRIVGSSSESVFRFGISKTRSKESLQHMSSAAAYQVLLWEVETKKPFVLSE